MPDRSYTGPPIETAAAQIEFALIMDGALEL
jgi:hypothetical protein